MGVFSQNTLRQLYVATALKTGALATTDSVGTLRPHADSAKNHLYFQQNGNGGLVRSDLIDLKNVLYSKATPSGDMAYNYKRKEVTVDPNVGLIAGQDYLLNLTFYQYGGLSEDNQYIKDVVVHAYSGMTLDTFYSTMYNNLMDSIKREITPIVNITLDAQAASAVMVTNTGITVTAKSTTASGNNIKFAIASISASTAGVTTVTSGGITTITASLTTAAHTIADLITLISGDTNASALITIRGTGSTAVAVEATAVALSGGGIQGIIFEEAQQDWKLGTMPFSVIPFDLFPRTVLVNGDNVTWGIVTNLSSVTTQNNGHQIADLEYFCMGNRGDFYRNMGWPNVIITKYIADPTQPYDTLDLKYYSLGNTGDSERAEKMITLVAIDNGSHTLMNSIINAINSTAGTTIATL